MGGGVPSGWEDSAGGERVVLLANAAVSLFLTGLVLLQLRGERVRAAMLVRAKRDRASGRGRTVSMSASGRDRSSSRSVMPLGAPTPSPADRDVPRRMRRFLLLVSMLLLARSVRFFSRGDEAEVVWSLAVDYTTTSIVSMSLYVVYAVSRALLASRSLAIPFRTRLAFILSTSFLWVSVAAVTALRVYLDREWPQGIALLILVVLETLWLVLMWSLLRRMADVFEKASATATPRSRGGSRRGRAGADGEEEGETVADAVATAGGLNDSSSVVVTEAVVVGGKVSTFAAVTEEESSGSGSRGDSAGGREKGGGENTKDGNDDDDDDDAVVAGVAAAAAAAAAPPRSPAMAPLSSSGPHTPVRGMSGRHRRTSSASRLRYDVTQRSPGSSARDLSAPGTPPQQQVGDPKRGLRRLRRIVIFGTTLGAFTIPLQTLAALQLLDDTESEFAPDREDFSVFSAAFLALQYALTFGYFFFFWGPLEIPACDSAWLHCCPYPRREMYVSSRPPSSSVSRRGGGVRRTSSAAAKAAAAIADSTDVELGQAISPAGSGGANTPK